MKKSHYMSHVFDSYIETVDVRKGGKALRALSVLWSIIDRNFTGIAMTVTCIAIFEMTSYLISHSI